MPAIMKYVVSKVLFQKLNLMVLNSLIDQLNDLGNGTVANGYCWLQSAKYRLIDEQIRLSLSMIDQIIVNFVTIKKKLNFLYIFRR